MKLIDFDLRGKGMMERLLLDGAVAVPCLLERDRARLLEDAQELISTITDESVGAYRVRQRFEFAEHQFGAESPFTVLRYALEEQVKRGWWLFHEFGGFNQIRLQRCPPSAEGVPVHREGKKFRNLVITVLLTGQGDFATLADRAGMRQKLIPTAPGDAIIMRMPGFMGTTDMPLHAVTNIREERVAVTYREDVTEKPAVSP